MRFRRFLLFIFLLCISFFIASQVHAQSYGLGFLSHETVQDNRTGLDLSPDKTLCFDENFELSFDFAFLPNRENYFGYIVRLINNDKQNIDLLYDRRIENKHFKLIIGEQFSNISFNVDEAKLLSGWTKFKIRFDLAKQQITLIVGDATYKQPIKLAKKNCFKMLFGSNDYLDFKTNDVPPMKLRNIEITKGQRIAYNWLLNESDGKSAREEISGNTAKVNNPLWIKKQHSNWQSLQTIAVNGAASVAFDPQSETVMITGSDSVVTYVVPLFKTLSYPYQSGQQYLMRGNQSYFDVSQNKLFHINTDQKQVSSFDFKTRDWDQKFSDKIYETNYWHINKFFNPTDSSFYFICGYGQFSYKNEVQRYNLNSKKWELLKVGGQNLTPRYLAALGATESGAYILGGYGSTTGQQILNPKNLYDLTYFDVKDRSFKKIYEFNIKGEDFVFANSMVIDKKSDSYYALIFPKHKYNSHLQMISGSLKNPSFKAVGNKIPYTFHDISSYADLYYCPKSKKFIAVTLFLNEKGQTNVSLFSLNSPPLAESTNSTSTAKPFFHYLVYPAIALLVILLSVFAYRRRVTRQQFISPRTAEDKLPDEIALIIAPQSQTNSEPATAFKNTIFLFGDLQLFDNEGNDITKYLTPLTKELLLIILLYTIRWGRGITSEKLKEKLWFDKTLESARNNRSVNIAKLKTVLDKLDNCHIIKESGHWKIEMDPQNIHVDYKQYLDTVNDKRELNKHTITNLADIIQRGNFLADVEYEWLDNFKSEISNEIIDTYLHFAASVDLNNDPEFLIKLANYIFYFDPVNEEAMALKCKSLIILGKHSIAKNAYESFCREYKIIYGEEFEKEFSTVLT